MLFTKVLLSIMIAQPMSFSVYEMSTSGLGCSQSSVFLADSCFACCLEVPVPMAGLRQDSKKRDQIQ